MTRDERAIIVAEVVEISKRLTTILDILMPDGEAAACSHPADRIVDDSTMDDDGQKYKCTLCGEERQVPFHTVSGD